MCSSFLTRKRYKTLGPLGRSQERGDEYKRQRDFYRRSHPALPLIPCPLLTWIGKLKTIQMKKPGMVKFMTANGQPYGEQADSPR